MIKFLKRLLGLDLLERLLEEDLKDLSSTDLVYLSRLRKIEKDIADLAIYLKIERIEEWKEDDKNPLNMPKLISSKWGKKK